MWHHHQSDPLHASLGEVLARILVWASVVSLSLGVVWYSYELTKHGYVILISIYYLLIYYYTNFYILTFIYIFYYTHATTLFFFLFIYIERILI